MCLLRCHNCAHMHAFWGKDPKMICEAHREGIPKEILQGEIREPCNAKNGISFKTEEEVIASIPPDEWG